MPVESEGVFGSHLNKRKGSKKTFSGVEERNKGPMRKLRKWTKDGGYKTVLGGESLNGSSDQKSRIEKNGIGEHTIKNENCGTKGDVPASSVAAKGNEVHLYTCR